MESQGTESYVFPWVFPIQTIELQCNAHKKHFLEVVKVNKHEHQCSSPFFFFPRSVPTFICRGISLHITV